MPSLSLLLTLNIFHIFHISHIEHICSVSIVNFEHVIARWAKVVPEAIITGFLCGRYT